MTNRKIALALMRGVIAVALVGGAIASDTKAMSTEGSLLITTSRELDAFPHLGMARDAHVGITSGYTGFSDSHANSDEGNLRLLFHLDEESGVLVRLHNDSFGYRVLSYAWGSSGNGTLGGGQILEADYLKSNFSVGVSLGMEDEGSGENGQTVFGGRGSFTTGEGQHVSGEITMASPEDDDFDSGMLAAALYRGEYDNGWTSHGGFYLAKPIAHQDADVDNEIGLMLSAGRRVLNTDRSQVGIECFFDYIKNDYNGDYDNFVFPGMRVGVVHQLTNLLDFHGGVHAGWEFMKENDSDDAPGFGTLADEDSNDAKEFSYDYTLGLGAHFGPVTVDLNVHPEAIPTLTRFGSEDHMFAQMSVEVVW